MEHKTQQADTYNRVNLCALSATIEYLKLPSVRFTDEERRCMINVGMARQVISEHLGHSKYSTFVDVDVDSSTIEKIVFTYTPSEIDGSGYTVPAGGKPIKITITAGIDAGIVGARVKCSKRWIIDALERNAFCLNSLSDELIIKCR